MLNIDIDITRDTKNFEIDKARRMINKNENVNNKFKVNIIEKKQQFIAFSDCDRKQFNRKAIDLKSDILLKLCD